ncbi:InlB B-repeat-containing protein [Nocardioides humi]|uniref:InlB B-repeat-containing protein n=1 Tax=Nocardioides humi TaxID=449461 RepID=UPI00112BC34F|nr:InlB B-repeat-containing protein [Nocardioides humi]
MEAYDEGSDTWSTLLVAGGGGGAGRSDDAAAETGGAGGDGGEVGAPGGDTSGGTGKGGGGGTAAAGGAGGTATDGVTTRTGRSGSATSGGGFGNMSGWTAGAAAAGGGEGWYGGGQGTVSFAGLAGGGGGGGSSHADASVTEVSYTVGANPHTSPTGGDGYISITYADPTVVPPAPEDVYVAAAGTDTGDCAVVGTACATLRYAYGQVADGGTVHVGPGTVPSGGGTLDGTKTVAVVGDPGGSTVNGRIFTGGDADLAFRDLTLLSTSQQNLAAEGDVSLDRVTVLNEDDDAAIAISGNGTMAIRNSTIAGAGVQTFGATVDLVSSTVVSPSYSLGGNAFGVINVAGSIVSGPCGSFGNGSKIVDQGHNVEDGCGSGANRFSHATTQHVSDVGLGALADNGGPTRTFLPWAASPVVDAVPLGTTACPAVTGTVTDQTGAERRQGTACNAGSVEEIAGPPADVYVEMPENGGADTGDCSSPAAACATLSYAYGQAAATATIHLGPGVFPAGATFTGSDRDVTIVGHPDGTRIGSGVYIYAPHTPSLTLRDLRLDFALSCSGAITLDRVLVTSAPEWWPYYGVRACGGTVEVRNSTFTGLTSAVYVDPGTTTGAVTFTGSTIAGISGGVVEGDASLVTLTGSIVADAAGGACAGPVNDGGHNLVDDDTCDLTATGSQGEVSDLALGSLGDHGGPTASFKPAATSPAVDLVPAGVAHCPAAVGAGKDQTGAARFQGAACDAGAVEQASLVTVTFDPAGGSAVAPVEVPYGTAVDAPADPTRPGYTFDGWYDGESAYDFATIVTDDLTLTAHWTLADVATVITDQPDDVTAIEGVDATFTATATGVPDPVARWEVSHDGGEHWVAEGGEIATVSGQPTTLTVPNVSASMDGYRYRVRFSNSVGGPLTTTPATLTVQTAPVVTLEPDDAEVNAGADAGFTAAASGRPAPGVRWQVDDGTGWADVSGATSETLDLTGVTEDMDGNRYRAVFSNPAGTAETRAATLTVRAPVTVTFDSAGGSAVAPVSVAYGTAVGRPADPTRAGYSFTGWYTSAGGSTPYAFATLVTAPVTLYAHWAPEGDLTVDAHPVIVTADRFEVRCHATTGTLRSCAATVTTRHKGSTVVLAQGEATASTADAVVQVRLTRAGRRLTRPALGGVAVTLLAIGVLDNGLTRHAERPSLLFAPKQTRRGASAMFGPDGARLTAAGKRFLDRIAAQAEQVSVLTCVGHTARTGNRVGNRIAHRLSVRRAKAACAYLVRRGVQVRTKVRVVGVGNTATRKGGAPRNRFVDVVVRHR